MPRQSDILDPSHPAWKVVIPFHSAGFGLRKNTLADVVALMTSWFSFWISGSGRKAADNYRAAHGVLALLPVALEGLILLNRAGTLRQSSVMGWLIPISAASVLFALFVVWTKYVPLKFSVAFTVFAWGAFLFWNALHGLGR